MMEYLPYGRQHIDEKDIQKVIQTLASDFLTQGPMVLQFENAVAQYHHCRYAVAFQSGTAALHGAYYVSCKIPFGFKENIIMDLQSFFMNGKPSKSHYKQFREQYWEFITTPLSFVATANAGLYCGGKPTFVDISQNTYCIDISQLEDAITADTRVITPVSYGGYPVDIEAICNLSKVKENNICIIHDACHAIGARLRGKQITDFADMTVLSFHPVKHITTGEGGMVLTNSKEYYDKLLLFRNHGITKNRDMFVQEPQGKWSYEMQFLGYNYRMSDIQCALGMSQIEKLNSFLYKRNQIAKIYSDEFEKIPWLSLPPRFSQGWLRDKNFENLKQKPDNLHSYHLYPIVLHNGIDRKDFVRYMHHKGIGVQVHYDAIYKQPFYKQYYDLQFDEIQEVSLPCFYDCTFEQVEQVIDRVKSYNAY